MQRDFSSRLKLARKNSGWTQGQLGKMSGIPATTIAHFESGKRSPSLESFEKLVVALSVSADYLLGFVDKPMVIPEQIDWKLAYISGDDRILLNDFIELLIKRNQEESDD